MIYRSPFVARDAAATIGNHAKQSLRRDGGQLGMLRKRPQVVVFLEIPSAKAAAREGFGGERYETSDMQKRVATHFAALSVSGKQKQT